MASHKSHEECVGDGDTSLHRIHQHHIHKHRKVKTNTEDVYSEADVKAIKPTMHLVTKASDETTDQLWTDIVNTVMLGEVVVFSELCEIYYKWRTTASGGLLIDPAKPDNEPSNARCLSRATKGKSQVYRILQVSKFVRYDAS
jgi:hypothetical protein